LFKRAVKIHGIGSYYSKFDQALKKKKVDRQKERNSNVLNKLTLYVEGSADEYFYELLSSELAERLEYEKVDAIAIGGVYSPKLVANLCNTTATDYLFLPEDDPLAGNAFRKRHDEILKNKPYLYVKPIVYYLNVESLYSDEYIARYLPPKEELDNSEPDKQLLEIERRLIRRFRSSKRQDMLRKLVQEHRVQSEIDNLISDIKKTLEKTKKDVS